MNMNFLSNFFFSSPFSVVKYTRRTRETTSRSRREDRKAGRVREASEATRE